MPDKKLLEEMEYWCKTALLSEIERLQDEVVQLKMNVNSESYDHWKTIDGEWGLEDDPWKAPYPEVEGN